MIPQNFADAFERVKELVSIFKQNEERIDDLVYQLYDLTPEEIAIVEGAQK